jgi:phage tail sheath protein FI
MATYKHRTTPGVYITELDAFPRSVVGVQTAVPAFIGYTEKAELSGKPVFYRPMKIGSLADYIQLFGEGFHELYSIDKVDPTTGSPEDDEFDFDFSCLTRVEDSSPPEYKMTYFKYSRLEDTPRRHAFLPGGASEEVLAELPGFNLYNALRLFYANGGGPCYVVSVGPYLVDDAVSKVSADALQKGLDAIQEQAGPTMLVIPDAVLLPTSDQFYSLSQNMLKQCADLQDRVSILDVYGVNLINQKQSNWKVAMAACLDDFHNNIGDKFLNYGMAYFPFLVTSIVQPSEIDYTNYNIANNPQWIQLKGILDDQADLLYPDEQKNETVKGYIDQIPYTVTVATDIQKLNQNLTNAIPLLGQMEAILARKMALMACSAAMAGVYTFTDASRGVWNAPANVSLSAVIEPNVQLNNDQQGELNMPLDGKAINVIRKFPGRGSVVWGARTLDGNSNDWRYIQVRRTLIYAEQSIEAALQPFVFAANDGKTWVAVTSMVSNFLQGLWSQGGLMGAKADEAFNVSCGLGSTMTPQDILDGYMIVQVTLQMIRPAEFIELTFKQKMQGLS